MLGSMAVVRSTTREVASERARERLIGGSEGGVKMRKHERVDIASNYGTRKKKYRIGWRP